MSQLINILRSYTTIGFFLLLLYVIIKGLYNLLPYILVFYILTKIFSFFKFNKKSYSKKKSTKSSDNIIDAEYEEVD